MINGMADTIKNQSAIIKELYRKHNSDLENIAEELAPYCKAAGQRAFVTKEKVMAYKWSYLGVPDEEDESDFDTRYVEYKRNVDTVNSHNDALADIAKVVNATPMPYRHRVEIIRTISSNH